MARGILGMLVNKGMSQALNRQPQGDPSVAKENRTALRSAADKAIGAGNLDVLSTLMDQMRSAGIDPGPYAAQAGQPTVEQQVQQLLNEVMQTGQISQPAQSTDAAINMPEGNQIAPQVRSKMADIFTPEFATRSALKALSGIDIGEDAFFKKQFYNDYKSLRDAGVTHSDAFVQLASKFGAIPDDASNLKEASTEERRVIFNRRFNKLMSDPVYNQAFKKAFPNSDEKGKAALIFQEMSKNGEWIDSNAQALVDRMMHQMTDTSEFLSKEQSAYAYKVTGKNPADLSPSEVALVVHGSSAEKRQQMIEDLEAQERTKWEVKLDQVIDPELAKEFNVSLDTTHRDLLSSESVPAGEEEQAIKKAIASAKKMRDTAMRLFTSDGINRFALGGKRKVEEFLQSNPDLAKWDSDRLSFAVRKARADGQKGNLRWEELQPLVNAVPGVFHSKTFAKAYFDGVISEMETMLSIEQSKLKQQAPVETPSDDGYEVGAQPEKDGPIYKGKDQYGVDIWEKD